MRTGAIALISAVGIIVLIVALLSIASDIRWKIVVAEDGGQQGPQGIFDAEIYQCAASLPARPAGGRWNVETHQPENLPADWYTDTQDCHGRRSPLQEQWPASIPPSATTSPCNGLFPTTSRRSAGRRAIGSQRRAWRPSQDKPFVAYGYHTGFYAISSKTAALDKEINLTATAWDKVTRVIVDQEAYEDDTNSTEVALAPVVSSLMAGSHIVISDPNTADSYGAYRITVDPTGADDAKQLDLSHIRSAGTPPSSGRVEARLYILGSSRLAVSRADNPIKPWVASTSYAVGDLVKYNNIVYQSRHAGSASVFTPSHWYNLALEPASGNAIGVSYPNNNQEFTIAVESGGIDTDELADGGVTTAKIADAAVTEAKMAAGVLPTVRGAGTGLELDGDDLDVVLDILSPAFPHPLVRTYVTSIGTPNVYEIAISNDNNSGALATACGNDTNNDALLVEKQTDGDLLDNLSGSDWFFLSRGDSRMLGRVFCMDDDPSATEETARVWFNGDATYKKSVNQYLQMGSGTGTVAFSALGSIDYLREALLTGATPALTSSTTLLLGDWGTATVEHLNEHVVPKTTGPTNVTATWETGVIDAAGKIGWQNVLTNGVGTLEWQIPASVPVQGGGTIPRADVTAYFNSHHTINVAVGSAVIKGPIQNFSLLSGRYYITIGDSIGTPNRKAATQTGTPADGATAVVQLDSSIPTKDEIADEALKVNIPSGAALVLVYGTASASANCIKWNTTNSRAEWAAC